MQDGLLPVRPTPGVWVRDHGPDHPSDLPGVSYKTIPIGRFDVVTGEGRFEPVLRFSQLSVSVRQLVNELCLIPALVPRLNDVRTHRPGGATDLIGE
jgi:hypothetical protein